MRLGMTLALATLLAACTNATPSGEQLRVTERAIAGKYWVVEKNWKGEVQLYEDGGFGRPTWGPKNALEGHWYYKDGVLTLAWNDWPAERLSVGFNSSDTKMTAIVPTAPSTQAK